MGGHRVGCLDLANFALLAKWWWRLKNRYHSFWFCCIKYIHNIKFVEGKMIAKKSLRGVWSSISQIESEFEDKGILFTSILRGLEDLVIPPSIGKTIGVVM